MRGRYLYGDYCSGLIWSLRLENGEAVDVRREEVSVPQLTSFGEDADGELYLVSQSARSTRLAAGLGEAEERDEARQLRRVACDHGERLRLELAREHADEDVVVGFEHERRPRRRRE